jgi:glycopeptide antibiotics resistance protein
MNWFLKALPDMMILLAIYIKCLYPTWKNYERNALVWHTFLYIYMCIILGWTIMPIFAHLLYAFDGVYENYNLLPFSDWIYGYGNYRRETLYNLMLFIPFGFIAQRTLRKPYRITLLYGALFSFTIEISQLLFTSNRVCDITDLINNTLGTLFGILLFILYDKCLK